MIGYRVKEIRMRKNISLSKLAERSKVAKSYLSNLERDICVNPTIDIVQKLAKALDVNPSYILNWKEIDMELESARDSLIYIKNKITDMDITQLEELKNHIDVTILRRKKLSLREFSKFI
ncbi:helix-turn-helix domain-containing protein [Priestia aryabhattai]|uniref:helix-turn-helix domain-containing protein n=1 Tax=Priestia TaxID=2800373 RepID=UPI00263BD7F2|nr:helix-turn-helix transcriptional regulator [Priestia megaterium]MDN4861139.1 helix-turn-helix transcriptional regulator [Priestia megaterium]